MAALSALGVKIFTFPSGSSSSLPTKTQVSRVPSLVAKRSEFNDNLRCQRRLALVIDDQLVQILRRGVAIDQHVLRDDTRRRRAGLFDLDVVATELDSDGIRARTVGDRACVGVLEHAVGSDDGAECDGGIAARIAVRVGECAG